MLWILIVFLFKTKYFDTDHLSTPCYGFFQPGGTFETNVTVLSTPCYGFWAEAKNIDIEAYIDALSTPCYGF